MELPRNRFKAALAEGRHQLGIWNSIGGPVVPELLAACGFDWILIDTEHSPLEVAEVLPALQAIAGYPRAAAVVRPAWNDPVLIKRHLDLGAQTLLIPFVQTAAEAEAAVRAMRYPPGGIRGVAGATRASRYGKVRDYVRRAAEELCLIVQVETAEALARLEEIAAVPGVDAVFIGPADLAASMGHAGNPGHPAVQAAVEQAIDRLRAMARPAGLLTTDPAFAARCIERGTGFTAVGVDLGLLAASATALADRFRGEG